MAGKKVLTLTKKANEAQALVATARAAVVAASSPEAREKATAAYADAVRSQVVADDALAVAKGGADARVTQYSEKHEKTKTVEEDDEDEPEDGDDSDADEEDEAPPSKKEKGAKASDDEDEDDEEKAAEEETAKAIAKGGPAAQRVAAALLAATGQKSITAALGAAATMPARIANASKIEADVAELKKSERATRVDAIIASAKADGKLTSKSQRAHWRAEGMAHGAKWLAAAVANMPKAVRTREDGAFVPRADADGNPRFSESEARMRESAIAGLDAAGVEKYDALMAKTLTDAGAARPTH